MTSNSILLEVITPAELFYKGQVEMLIVNTLNGQEGFMANHAWACKLLADGKLRIKEAGQSTFREAKLVGGYVDIKDEFLVYADHAEWL
ncbi:MAG: F0F1 ATP synthase subunit delta [Anaerovoracaceae bacterium]